MAQSRDKHVRFGDETRKDLFGIPACFYWTTDEVADWIDSIGYSKYKENFRSHFINGRRLLTVDACTLPKMGIVHFGDILALCHCLKEVQGKAPKTFNFRPLQEPTLHAKEPVPAPRESLPEYLCSWRSSFPDYFYGHHSERRQLTGFDFQTGWWLNNCAYKKCAAQAGPTSHLSGHL